MTQNEIIEMARQVCDIAIDNRGRHTFVCDEYGLEAFAKLVAQHEREACAIVCDDINAKYKWPDDVAERVASQWCADSIRARSNT
jgi:hypothetical protein